MMVVAMMMMIATLFHPHPPYNDDIGDHHSDNYPQNIGDIFIMIINDDND